jgi:AcrR family transcriptional regulator
MPISRLKKLAPEKRERLFEVAAQEFASRGFEQASLNRILEQAQMGKSSAYYYFEDKADLFCAVIEHARERLQLDDLTLDLAALTAQTFWSAVAAVAREQLVRSFEHPWLFRVLRGFARLSPTLWEREPLAGLLQQFSSLVMQLIKRGQELGVIRADLPDDLLAAWLFALDQASDQWLMSHWEQMDRAACAAFSDTTVAVISHALAPGASAPFQTARGDTPMVKTDAAPRPGQSSAQVQDQR